jgi:hypothetical protein
MLQNSPFLLAKLKMLAGQKFETTYKMDVGQGLQSQVTTFDPYTNTVDEGKVEQIHELLQQLAPHVAYFVGHGIPTDLMFNYLIEVQGAKLPDVPDMERYQEQVNSEAENEFLKKFKARDYTCFERIFNRITVAEVEMDDFQQSVKIAGLFYPPAATNVAFKYILPINIDTEFPGKKSTGYVFYQEVKRIVTELQAILCELVNDSLSSQKRQLELFQDGDYTNSYFDQPSGGSSSDHVSFDISEDIESVEQALAS